MERKRAECRDCEMATFLCRERCHQSWGLKAGLEKECVADAMGRDAMRCDGDTNASDIDAAKDGALRA